MFLNYDLNNFWNSLTVECIVWRHRPELCSLQVSCTVGSRMPWATPPRQAESTNWRVKGVDCVKATIKMAASPSHLNQSVRQ